MKILFVSAGKSIHTVRWVNELAERGHEIHLVFCKNHKPNYNKLNEKINCHTLPFSTPFGYYLNAVALKKINKKVNPDAINVHYASGYGTLSRLARLPNTVLSVWGSDVYDFPNQSKFKEKTLRKNLKYASQLASTSNVMAEQTRKFLDDKSKPIVITPFGVDISKFKPIDNFKDESKILIGTVKALSKKYGITDSIKAFKLLYEDFMLTDNKLANKLYYEIYGDGEQKEEIEHLIKSLSLEERVTLKGYVENNDLPKILNTFDIFVANSIYNSESFGVAAIEAMACGVPVLVSDADGFKEVVENEVTGLIVEKQNIKQIYQAMAKCVLDKSIRQEYGNNGRIRVVKLYDWKENVSIMEKLLTRE